MTTTILSLPPELLDQVYAHLDWNPAQDVVPKKEDIVDVSLTCRRLRETVLPFLFRDVTLKLRWSNSAFVEPALLKMRRRRPDLADHVRCVYIKPEFMQIPDPKFTLKPMDFPQGTLDWINPARDLDDHARAENISHRRRATDVAKALFESPEFLAMLAECPTEFKDKFDFRTLPMLENKNLSWDAQRLMIGPSKRPTAQTRLAKKFLFFDSFGYEMFHKEKRYWDVWVRLHALVLVLLCLPPSVNSLVFKVVHRAQHVEQQKSFAFHVLATAIRIFGNRLQRLTMSTVPQWNTRHERSDEHAIITDHAIQNLQTVDTLVLSGHDLSEDFHTRRPGRFTWFAFNSRAHWHCLAHTVTYLELWDVQSTSQELEQFITGFSGLKSLTLRHDHMSSDGSRLPRFPQGPPPSIDQSTWLTFLIKIRRQMPELTLHLSDLSSTGQRAIRGHLRMPQSAIRWLLQEAVPTGCVIGYDREVRLVEDFESFMPLWCAEEDKGRGVQAINASKDGKLIELALNSLWSAFTKRR